MKIVDIWGFGVVRDTGDISQHDVLKHVMLKLNKNVRFYKAVPRCYFYWKIKRKNEMSFDEVALTKFNSILPKLSEEENAIISELPDEYYIDVEYITQEQKHWSGAAVAQMLFRHFEEAPTDQKSIALAAGLDDWRAVNHETLKEDFARFMAKNN
ncbi:hypothetical protein AB833_14815 [Chromatiales bacterium (ex Bugula neritina AB1)]|nr:hypothetical protein AB833_14815 [Chromatiales bacterium (ex Bugula neritina AB1)]